MVGERCWTLIGAQGPATGTWRVRLERAIRGEETKVDADWSWTLAREETHGDVAGFYHTHPAGTGTGPSGRDTRTMQAWCGALGKRLLCVIAEEGREQDPGAWLFEDDERQGLPVGPVVWEGQDHLTVQER